MIVRQLAGQQWVRHTEVFGPRGGLRLKFPAGLKRDGHIAGTKEVISNEAKLAVTQQLWSRVELSPARLDQKVNSSKANKFANYWTGNYKTL